MPPPVLRSLPVLVDLVAELHRFQPGHIGEVGAIRSVDDAPRRVDDYATPVAVLARENGLLHVTALDTDARDEDGHITDDVTHFAQLVGECRPHDNGTVAPRVPVVGDVLRDMEVERPAGHDQILELARTLVGGAAEHNDTLVRLLQERFVRLGPEVGMDRHRIRPEEVEGQFDIAMVGRADVPALGVENHWHIRRRDMDVRDGAPQSRNALRAILLVERDVRLIGADQVTGRHHDLVVEGDDGVGDVDLGLVARPM